jgi:hypothetical protein
VVVVEHHFHQEAEEAEAQSQRLVQGAEEGVLQARCVQEAAGVEDHLWKL